MTWSSGVPVATNNRRLQVVCTTSTTDRDQRVAAGIAAGFPSAWEHVPASGCWRVYIGERPLPIDATAEATYKQNVINAGLATTAALWKTVNATINEPRYVTTKTTGTSASSRNPPRVTVASTARVLIGGATQYRGDRGGDAQRGGHAGRHQRACPWRSTCTAWSRASWAPCSTPRSEAQKAQAVAARTYAHANLGKHWNNGYDLLATVQDQVYGGSAAEHPVSTAAVNATAGIVATYNGALINALFYATSGGRTANAEDVFTGTERTCAACGTRRRGRSCRPSTRCSRTCARPRGRARTPAGTPTTAGTTAGRWRR